MTTELLLPFYGHYAWQPA